MGDLLVCQLGTVPYAEALTLQEELRANLISIAIWILKEIEKIRKRESTNFQGIIDITTIIKDGIQ